MLKESSANNRVKSFSLIEVVLAISLFAVFVTTIIGTMIYAQESLQASGKRSRANILAQEGLEAARAIRNKSFDELTSGSWGLDFAGGKWVLNSDEETIGGFKREIGITDEGENTKKISATITWSQTPNLVRSIALYTILTNWLKIDPGSWTDPEIEEPLPLPDLVPAVKIQTKENYAYAVRDTSNSNFMVFDITHPTSPQLKAELTLPGQPTNIALYGDFAYISNRHQNYNIQAVNISNPEQPVFNDAWRFRGLGNAPGTSIAIQGNRAYLTREYRMISASPTFYTVDITDPTKMTSLGYIRLAEPSPSGYVNAFDVYVSGNYAYVASSFHDSGSGSSIPYIQTIDITNPQPVHIATHSPLNIDEENWGSALSISGWDNSIVLGQDSPGNRAYAYTIDNPASPSLVASFQTDGKVNDVGFGPNSDFAYLATDAGEKEFQILDLSALPEISLFGATDLPSAANGICYSSGKDRVFVVSSDGHFIVISPQ